MSGMSFRLVNLSGFIERARILEGETGVSVCESVSQLEEATIERQLLILSSVSSHIVTACLENQKKIAKYYMELLCHIYLSAESKSPLKQSASRLLMKFSEEYGPDIAECLSKGLIDMMKPEYFGTLNHVLNKICDCFENFSIGIDAISLCLNEILSFICNCLRQVLENISESLSPIQQMEFIIRGHSALRAAVMVLQKFLLRMKKITGCNSANEAKVLKDMLHVSTQLLNHELVPMDSKGNCGMVIVILSIAMHEDGYDVVLNKLTAGQPLLPRPMGDLENVYFESKVAQMSVCSGLITVVPMEVLCTFNSNSEKFFLEAVIMKLVCLSESTESALTLGCSRTLQQAIHIIHIGILKKSCLNCLLMLTKTQILTMSLDFVWSRLDHYMDCVRHSAKAMLHDLVQIGSVLREKEAKDSSLVEIIINAVEKIPSYKKSKYIALAVLANELGCQKLMKVFPDLVSTLLVVIEDPSMSAHVSNAFESLMLKDFKEECESSWINTWIRPVFETYSKSRVCYILEGIMSKAMKICPSLLDYTVSSFDGDFIVSSQLKVFIVCLKIGTKLGVIDKKSKQKDFCKEVDKWKGIIKYDVITQALVNQDDEVRVSALSLIIESNKTTQCLNMSEMELMKCFLWYNVNSDSAALKQKNLMLLKKLLTRIRESAYPIVKSLKHSKENDSQVDETNENLIAYRDFLKWFEVFCFKCLFPGANFSRRASALEMLTMLNEMLSMMDETLSLDSGGGFFAINWQENHAELLLYSLKDSFESNKNLAVNLLMKFPADILGITTESRVSNILNIGLKLASSIKPPDCITGAYFLKLLASFSEAEVFLEEIASKISPELLPDFHAIAKNNTFYKKNTFCIVWILITHLKKELAIAKYNLLLAAGSGPMYGTLFAIRHLLKNLDFDCIAENLHWKSTILDLINLCFELNAAVIHIVNSSSPEGHLPMDFEPASIHEPLKCSTAFPLINVKEESEASFLQIPPVTAQMVLLCSWRTVKEVSLFLGEVTNQAPILIPNPLSIKRCHLLTEDLVIGIGDHFTKLLSETKHRGAFEQAYVGFCQLCKKLWKHPSGILSQLPRLWLKDIMNEITKGKKASKLCATRRSAGVPFIVQALVTTELDVRQPTCLKEAMEVLLDLLEEKSSEREEWNEGIRTESHTHAMNILRALFRHTLLGELVTPYISRGIMAAVNGFKGDTWAERNSATLLFGSLISRVFGVKHSKEDVHRRNRMTGRVFFERFPALYDFMLGELREAAYIDGDVTNISTLNLFPSLFPVLLILSRLYPSSLEGTDSNMQLSAFVHSVQCCLKSKIYKIRELAARAMVPLITSNIYIGHLDEAFSLATSCILGQNKIHGILLQVSFLLQEVPYPQQENEEMVCKKVEIWVNFTQTILTNHKEFSYMVKEAYIRVLRHLLFISSGSLLSPFPKELWDKVFQNLKIEIWRYRASPNECLSLGDQTFICRATQILLEIAVIMGHSSESLVELLSSFLMEPVAIECAKVVLSFICHIFGEVGNECMEEEDSLPLFPWSRKGHWQMKTINYRSHFVKTKNLAIATVNVLSLAPPSYVLQSALRVTGHLGSSALSISWHIQGNSKEKLFEAVNPFSHLISLCNLEPENVGRAALFCLTSLVQEAVKIRSQEYLSPEIGSHYCDFLMEFSSPEKNELSRMIVAESLVINHSLFSQHGSFLTIWDQCRLWVILLDLMEDHNVAVRDAAAKISNNFMSVEGGLKNYCSMPAMPCENKNRENDSYQSGSGDNWRPPEISISFQLSDVMPQRLEEMILMYFEKVCGSCHKYECVVTLLAMALRDRTSGEGEYDINEERVFDKGEANLFAEPLNLTKKCAKHLKNILLDVSLLEVNMVIPSSIMKLVGLDECNASSIMDFIKYSIEKLMGKLETCSRICGQQFDAFLTQGFDAMQQEVFKMGLILCVLKEFSTEISELSETFFKKLEHTGILSTFSLICN